MRKSIVFGLIPVALAATFAVACGSSSSGTDETPAAGGSSAAGAGGSSAGTSATGGAAGTAGGAAGSSGTATGGSAGKSTGGSGGAAGAATGGSGGSTGGSGGSTGGSGGSAGAATGGTGGSTGGSAGAATGGTGGSTGGSAGAATGGTGGSAVSGWTALKLLDDTTSDPGTTIDHSVNDWVQAIYFDSPTNGFIATFYEGPNNEGGAIFHASSATNVDKIQYAGTGQNKGQGESYLNFFTVGKLGDGSFFALTDHGDTWASSPDGTTWSSSVTGNGFNENNYFFGAQHDTTNNLFWLADSFGEIYKSTTAPGTSASFTDVWDPDHTTDSMPGDDPIPNPIPAGACQHGENSATLSFEMGYPFQRAYLAKDSSVLAYTSQDKAAACVSTDKGASFLEKDFGGGLTDPPDVLYYSDPMHAWAASYSVNAKYVVYSTDGGQTWTAGTLPSNITDTSAHDYQLDHIFFEPTGTTGFIVGGDMTGSDRIPMLLKTTDGGKTWKDITAGLANSGGVISPGDQSSDLYTGFTLDGNSVWIGGHDGVVLYSATGGELAAEHFTSAALGSERDPGLSKGGSGSFPFVRE